MASPPAQGTKEIYNLNSTRHISPICERLQPRSKVHQKQVSSFLIRLPGTGRLLRGLCPSPPGHWFPPSNQLFLSSSTPSKPQPASDVSDRWESCRAQTARFMRRSKRHPVLQVSLQPPTSSRPPCHRPQRALSAQRGGHLLLLFLADCLTPKLSTSTPKSLSWTETA
jgi:hypothetical protein